VYDVEFYLEGRFIIEFLLGGFLCEFVASDDGRRRVPQLTYALTKSR